MIITTLGNCQTMALCKYIRILKPEADAKFCSVFQSNPWTSDRQLFGDQVDHVIYDMHEKKRRLIDSDFVLYQAMALKRAGDKQLTQPGLRETNQQNVTQRQLSITSFMLKDEDRAGTFEGMLTREHKNNIDIRATDIINKHPGLVKNTNNTTGNHPNAFYFLEVMREICTRWDWDYYSDEQYEQLIEQGYPFG